jgi:hypothetical protein
MSLYVGVITAPAPALDSSFQASRDSPGASFVTGLGSLAGTGMLGSAAAGGLGGSIGGSLGGGLLCCCICSYGGV